MSEPHNINEWIQQLADLVQDVVDEKISNECYIIDQLEILESCSQNQLQEKEATEAQLSLITAVSELIEENL